jgi:hypothetical protein
MTNTYTTPQNIQKEDRNITLADLEFSTTSDSTLRVYSFKADLT